MPFTSRYISHHHAVQTGPGPRPLEGLAPRGSHVTRGSSCGLSPSRQERLAGALGVTAFTYSMLNGRSRLQQHHTDCTISLRPFFYLRCQQQRALLQDAVPPVRSSARVDTNVSEAGSRAMTRRDAMETICQQPTYQALATCARRIAGRCLLQVKILEDDLAGSSRATQVPPKPPRKQDSAYTILRDSVQMTTRGFALRRLWETAVT